MALETFDGSAGTLPSPPWTDHGVGTAWRRNGSGAAQPSATGQYCLASYVGAAQGDPLTMTFGSTGGGSDYVGIACFIGGTGGSASWYTVELNLGAADISLNLFQAGNYVTTVTSWFTPGAVNQAVGDKIEVTCSLVGGRPTFAIRYWDASAGSPAWATVATYTDNATSSPPTGSGFGMFAYTDTGIGNSLVAEWDDGNVASETLEGSVSEGFEIGDTVSGEVVPPPADVIEGSVSEGLEIGDTVSASLIHGATLQASLSEGIVVGHRLGIGRVADFPAEGLEIGDTYSAEVVPAPTDTLEASIAEGAVIGDEVSATLEHGATLDGSVSEGAVIGDEVAAELQHGATLDAAVEEGFEVGDDYSATLTPYVPGLLTASVDEGVRFGDSYAADLIHGATIEAAVAEGLEIGDTLTAVIDTPDETLEAEVAEGWRMGDSYSARVVVIIPQPLTGTLTVRPALTGSLAIAAEPTGTLNVEPS